MPGSKVGELLPIDAAEAEAQAQSVPAEPYLSGAAQMQAARKQVETTRSASIMAMTEDELIAAALEFQSTGGPAYDAALKKLLPGSSEAADTDANLHRLLSQLDQSPPPPRQDPVPSALSGATPTISRMHASEEAKLVKDALAFQSNGGTSYDEALQKLTLAGQQASSNPVESTLQGALKGIDIEIADQAVSGSTSSAEQASGEPLRPPSTSADDSSGQSTLEQVGQVNRANLRERRRRLAMARSKGREL